MPEGDAHPKKPSSELEAELAAMARDLGVLKARIRTLQHTVECEVKGINFRLHFPAFRQGKTTISEMIECIALYLTGFCLPRSQVKAVHDLYGTVSADEFSLKTTQLFESARSLFKRANHTTNRNGEAGELLLYLLTEWVLGAPQLIAKMSLKTNREMPVHGADGVHVKFLPNPDRLMLYWGESKIYSDVGAAITAAIESVATSREPEKLKHELNLVQRNIDFTGLDNLTKDALLRYLDPFEEAYNERYDVSTCLIGFDFAAYTQVTEENPQQAEKKFSALACSELAKLAPKAAKTIKAAGVDGNLIELFFFPVPSVSEFRDLFQEKIGWNE